MKTLVYKDSKEVLYYFENSVEIKIYDDKSIVYFTDGNKLEIAQCRESNTIFYDDVTIPDNWMSHKYLYDPSANPQWSINPDWIESASE